MLLGEHHVPAIEDFARRPLGAGPIEYRRSQKKSRPLIRGRLYVSNDPERLLLAHLGFELGQLRIHVRVRFELLEALFDVVRL